MKIKELEVEHIIKIHDVLVDHYNIPKGHVDEGKIESILEKIKFLNDDDLLQRASILLEGLIRLHVFTDGNKRTALESVKIYLNFNNYFPIFPLSTMTLSYKIASTQGIDPESNEKLIQEIHHWLKMFAVNKNDKKKIRTLFLIYYKIPIHILQFCKKTHMAKLGNFILSYYLKMNVKDVDKNMLDSILNLLRKQSDT